MEFIFGNSSGLEVVSTIVSFINESSFNGSFISSAYIIVEETKKNNIKKDINILKNLYIKSPI